MVHSYSIIENQPFSQMIPRWSHFFSHWKCAGDVPHGFRGRGDAFPIPLGCEAHGMYFTWHVISNMCVMLKQFCWSALSCFAAFAAKHLPGPDTAADVPWCGCSYPLRQCAARQKPQNAPTQRRHAARPVRRGGAPHSLRVSSHRRPCIGVRRLSGYLIFAFAFKFERTPTIWLKLGTQIDIDVLSTYATPFRVTLITLAARGQQIQGHRARTPTICLSFGTWIAHNALITHAKPFRVTLITLAVRGQQSSGLLAMGPYDLAQSWHKGSRVVFIFRFLKFVRGNPLKSSKGLQIFVVCEIFCFYVNI